MSATNELDRHLQDLEDTWDYSHEELDDIRDKMIEFANTVSYNENMRKEIANIEKIY